ncbi:serine/arginine repetitive matrix protein 1-like [Oryza brachyantha]|uniref:serine/arginine repetitive matrix protein 1-like n=1 Tax=Oryza brachyantha TaxID=4533 RepID=UPI001ADC816D|nr:serine/arginine repetitive matrix protein 1-like [Oryza brachyantha]
MSGQPPPPPQPQPFRFWLPYRSNVGSSRQQPRPPSGAVPASSRHQPPPPPPPPTPAGRGASPARAMEEEMIPVQGESSDESDTIPVHGLDLSRWRRATPPSMPDLELTLSRSPRAGEERSPRGGEGGGNDTKISISGFPRSRLFDGARAPYRREIEDGLKSLAGRVAPAPRADGGQGYRVITLAGHNVGASMVLGGGPREHEPEGSARPPAVAANVNSNVQSVNNSSMEASTCSAGDPGVRVDIKNARDEPVVVAAPPKRAQEEEKPKETVVRRPPLAVPAPQPENREAPRPPRARRCLRALMMESESDREAAQKPTPKPKPKPSACRFQCVTDHAPKPAATSNGGGDGKSGEEGGKENTR